MLKDEDLRKILLTLRNLRRLQLRWCHLLQFDSLVQADALRELSLWKTAWHDDLFKCCPNVEDVRLEEVHFPGVAPSLTLWPKLRRLGVGNLSHRPNGAILAQKFDMSFKVEWLRGLASIITHLWLTGDTYKYQNAPDSDPRIVAEIEIIRIIKPIVAIAHSTSFVAEPNCFYFAEKTLAEHDTPMAQRHLQLRTTWQDVASKKNCPL